MRKKPYLTSAAIALLMFIGVLLLEGIGALTEREDILKAFCDAFFVPGILLTSFGILVRIAGEGVFDTLSYGVKSLAALFTPIGKKPPRYYEYRKARAEARKTPQPCILRVGLICLLAAAACLGMYYM